MKTYGQQDYRKQLDGVFRRTPGKSAIVNLINEKEKRIYTYRKLERMTAHVKRVLESNGISPCERVAVLTPPSGDMAAMLLALAYLGYTAVLPDVALPAEERNRLLKFAEPSMIVTTDALYETLDPDLKNTLPVYRLFSGNTPLKRLNPGLKQRKKPEIPGKQDIIAILFSSGTTGSVKGVEVPYQSLFYAWKAGMTYGNYTDNSPHFLQVLPLSHVAGFSMMQINLMIGAEMGFVPELTAAGLTLGLKVYQPTHMIMIPKVYETIQKKMQAEIAKRPFPVRAAFTVCCRITSYVRKRTGIRLRWLTRPFYAPALGRRIIILGCGAEPCELETVRFFLDLGIEFLNAYGSTEASFPITASSVQDGYPDRGAGNVRQFPFIDIRIENEEILVKSALMMNGYFRDPESTRKAFTPDGYLKTGDLGYIDRDGYLYITGRRKETIQLSNGHKVSAPDVDSYYQAVSGDVRVACCGIPDDYMHTDHLVLFIESAGLSSKEIEQLKKKLRSRSESNGTLYRLADILTVPELPTTTLGKIKRYQLRQIVEALDAGAKVQEKKSAKHSIKAAADIPEYLAEFCEIVRKYVPEDTAVTPDARLTEDLSIDSITMFELCTELQTVYDTDLMELIGSVETVRDLADVTVKKKHIRRSVSSTADVKDFPLERRRRDMLLLNGMMRMFGSLYDFEITGTEQLRPDGHYIFCPNHESHLDGLWVWTALKGTLDCSRVACLAKQEHLDTAVTRQMLRMLGGIPTDRSGNPAPAMERAEQVIRRGDTQFLIHPEGTRTRNGEMGRFKKGVASLSMDTGVPIVPVCITGAYEIYPAGTILPKFYDFKNHRKPRLQIAFGAPIMPAPDDTADTLTEKLYRAVTDMRKAAL